MNLQGIMAQKLKASRAPLRSGRVVGNAMAARHHWYPVGVSCNAQSKEETGEKGEAKDQVPMTCRRAEH